MIMITKIYLKVIALESELRIYLTLKTVNIRKDAHKNIVYKF